MKITTERTTTFEFETATAGLVVLTPEEAMDLRDSLDKALKANGFIPTPPHCVEPTEPTKLQKAIDDSIATAKERQRVIDKAERELAVEKLLREQREAMERATIGVGARRQDDGRWPWSDYPRYLLGEAHPNTITCLLAR
ncbi:hypothetical protein UFOVP708_21 [uncultured Caudovirales phage]|uniref:Uncharacterized protein n=1 Tax=uncultured Caudovirales phage TaxID=2100421 RepID=A0A6J5NU71_9CAUD|nr:hypothetical protein UFOVP708_21 [uncultured Caudovirales phage]